MPVVERNISIDFKENGIDRTYDEEFSLICKNIEIIIKPRRFIYFIDEKYVMDTTKGWRYENLTPAYEKILVSGLDGMRYEDEQSKFHTSYNSVIYHMMLLADRIIQQLSECDYDVTQQRCWFENLKNRPAQGFEEAIQRMLFVNQMFWQTDHRLTGLGAWDSILAPYYERDIELGILTKEKALHIIKDLYIILHDNYEFKSNVLMGDTGQIFVLGKSDLGGNYIYNDLTLLFIEAMKELQFPEPKCLLRVNNKTPREVIELALDAIATGIGAPLLANDDVIIPKLIEFGIMPEDACAYTTSACWEPLIGGKSASLNNQMVLNYVRALDNLLKREDLKKIHTFAAACTCTQNKKQ